MPSIPGNGAWNVEPRKSPSGWKSATTDVRQIRKIALDQWPVRQEIPRGYSGHVTKGGALGRAGNGMNCVQGRRSQGDLPPNVDPPWSMDDFRATCFGISMLDRQTGLSLAGAARNSAGAAPRMLHA